MRTPQIIPVEEFVKAALLFDAVGRWAQIDPLALHGPPQALDEDVVVQRPRPSMPIAIPRSRSVWVNSPHPSGCPVDDRDQVQKPLPHRDIGYVGGPHPRFREGRLWFARLMLQICCRSSERQSCTQLTIVCSGRPLSQRRFASATGIAQSDNRSLISGEDQYPRCFLGMARQEHKALPRDVFGV